MEGDGRPTNEVVAVACGRGCGGRGVHLTPAPRDQDHQHKVRKQGPGGSGEGDDAARPRLFAAWSRSGTAEGAVGPGTNGSMKNNLGSIPSVLCSAISRE